MVTMAITSPLRHVEATVLRSGYNTYTRHTNTYKGRHNGNDNY